MKHHFADFLDREDDHWTIVPNNERFKYWIKNIDSQNSDDVKIVTITGQDENWEDIFSFSNLEELTLNEPSKEQLASVPQLKNLKRLRITHARPKDIEFMSNLKAIEEIVLEYVSGFSDLSPLQNLKNLRSVHFENLHRVLNFDELRGIKSLKYIYIGGTLDWDQPIENFQFLNYLPNLEVINLGFIKSLSPYPALQPLTNLKKLKRIHIGMASFPLEEYAFVEAKIPNVEGAIRKPCVIGNNDIYFLGKGMRVLKSNSPVATKRSEEYTKKYNDLVEKTKKHS